MLMVGSIALMLLGAAASPTPCDALASVKLDKATITSSVLVPEGPVPTPTPARSGRGRGAGGGGRGGGTWSRCRGRRRTSGRGRPAWKWRAAGATDHPGALPCPARAQAIV